MTKHAVGDPTGVGGRGIERYILKKCDISRNQVPTKTRVVTSIPFLNPRITKTDTFQRLLVEFRHLRTNISNKTGTPKYPRLNRKQRFTWKNDVIRSVPIQD